MIVTASALALLVAGMLCAGPSCLPSEPQPPAPDAAQATAPPIASGETTLRAKDGSVEAVYRYRLVEPPASAIADPGSMVPLIVFLHGAGERGSDNAAQLKHFAGACADASFQAKHPCYVLAMQCPADETWSAIDLKGFRARGEMPKFAQEPTRAMRAVMQALDSVLATKAVDPTRVYLTGLSMGGFGSFDLAVRRTEVFAAVVPICGGGDPATAEALAAVPFYIVHGSDDAVVPVALSRAMREAIESAARTRRGREGGGGTPESNPPAPPANALAPNPMYREYDGVGHDSWTPAYRFGEAGVLDWMFAQRRGPATGGNNAAP